MEPVPPNAIDGYELLSPSAIKQFEAIHQTQREQDIAIQRVFEARKLVGEVEQLRSSIGGLSNLSSVPALLEMQAGRMAEIIGWRSSMSEQITRVLNAADHLNDRLGGVERSFARIEVQITGLSSEIARVSTVYDHRIKGVDSDLAELERKQAATIAKLDDRIGSLERDRTIVKAWAVGLSFLVGIAVWAITRWWAQK
jgi:uncharacterized coiled-coil DUF342 family protein